MKDIETMAVPEETESEAMEIDNIGSEAVPVNKPNVMNGNVANASMDNGISESHEDFTALLENIKNLARETYRESLDGMVKGMTSTLKDISCLLQETETIQQNLSKFIADNRPIFKTPIILPKSQFRKNADSKSALNTSVNDGLEIVSHFVGGQKVNLPPEGELIRSELAVNKRVWAMKTNLLNLWVKGTVTAVRLNGSEKTYKVRLDNQKYLGTKPIPAKNLAYDTPATVKIPVGTRIIAKYTDSEGRSAHYAGIVAEPPKITNLKRYLIFFDDGCAQYVKHEDVYVVCAQSVDVADNVHENISDFVRGYLQQYPERPMVKLQKGQCIKTEYNFEWSDARVLEVDCSMVKMLFLTSQRIEWIYRGSTRLKPLRNELANAEAHRLEGKNRRRHNVPRKPHQPYVEYTREDVVVLDSDSDDDKKHANLKTEEVKTNKPRNTARKSLATRPFGTLNIRANPVYHVTDKRSHVGYKDTARIKSFTRQPFKIHGCSMACRETDPIIHKGKNPLLIPVLLGWERQLRKFRSSGPGPKQIVVYRTFCGRHLRSLQEIQNYLQLVESRLTIDQFSLDPNLNLFRSFRPKEIYYKDDDITCGKENLPVSCINSLSDEKPPYVEYSAERFPGEGVFLNLDPEFLVGCDCVDDCQDPAVCSCLKITHFAKYGNSADGGEDVGYKFRRLREPVVTGIYECNSRCKCNSRCGNRVVQNGLTVRLQMFKTQYKGWGIRCLDDIDAGQFICVYAGQLLTEQGADADGKECGDEYLAELDHIEVVEKTKEGYESDVPEFRMEIDFDMPATKKEKEETVSSDDNFVSSDSDVLFDSDYDSEYESSLRTTATSTYATRSRQKNGKRSSNASLDCVTNSNFDDSNSVSESDLKIAKDLPDLTLNLGSTFQINPQPLSPESLEALEKVELKRKPKIENGVSDNKSVAKKSLSMRNPFTSLICMDSERPRSIRIFYGEDSVYIMDAKSKGNIGRYLNHSCEPNVFVQNVFVDTHDLRFPCVAFFAHDTIDAGTELTWDYNYEVGSVTDKVMYCYCEAASCRGRLL